MGFPTAAAALPTHDPLPNVHPCRDKALPPVVQKDSKIVIVGGGPAGIHMAHLLKQYGFNHVVVLERHSAIGGKSRSVALPDAPDVPHDVGTCFMHPGYNRMVRLIDAYHVPYHKAGGPKYGKYTIFSPQLNKQRGHPEKEPQEVGPWILADVESLVVPRWFRPCLPDPAQILTVEVAVHRYIALHKKIFGEYEYPLPPRPTPEMMKEIDMTFMAFIKRHRFEALIPFFLLGSVAQGYGLLDSIPALYGLWWNTPDFAASLINTSPLASMVQPGFQHLWKVIAEKDELNVVLDTTVTSITRNLGDREKPVIIETKTPEGDKVYEADFVIMATPLKHLLKSVVADTTSEEKELFFTQKYATLVTSIYQSKVKDVEEQAVTYFPERLHPQDAGRFYAERNSERALFPDREFSKEKRAAVTYQYAEENFLEDQSGEAKEEGIEKKLAEFKEILVRDLKEVGYTDVEVVHQYYWDYFPKYSLEHIRKHYPWKILDLQGTNRCWYIGSSTCFESVEDVVGYNHLLLQVFNIEDSPTSKSNHKH